MSKREADTLAPWRPLSPLPSQPVSPRRRSRRKQATNDNLKPKASVLPLYGLQAIQTASEPLLTRCDYGSAGYV